MKILLIENGFNDLKKSRYPLGSYLQSLGNDVYYACPDPKEAGVFDITMSRNSLAPIQLINGFGRLSRIERESAIEVVLSFRLVPNVLNYMASFRNGRLKRVTVITGLGFAFLAENNSIKTLVQRTLIRMFYRVASKRVQIIAQNPDDLTDLGVKNGNVILGSGLERTELKANQVIHTDSLKLLFVGRLLKSKGIITAISIFEQLKLINIDASLTIAGTIDLDNPDSITDAELAEIKTKAGVNYLGFVSEMDSVYQECNILLFPSTYREGVPRVILEALNYGLTIITKDMPGCKETVHGNGFLIKKNCSTMNVIKYLVSLGPNEICKNNRISIELFEKKFSASKIYPQYARLCKVN